MTEPVQGFITEPILGKAIIDSLHKRTYSEECEILLASSKDPIEKELAGKFLTTCRAITKYCNKEQNDLVQYLDQFGIKSETDEKIDLKTFHTIRIKIDSKDFIKAIEALRNKGYTIFPWTQIPYTDLRFFTKNQDSFLLMKFDDCTTRLVISFINKKSIKNKATRLFTPTIPDYNLISLPKHLWFLYHFIKPLRLLYGYFWNRNLLHAEPYLGTPISLISPLLKFAKVSTSDFLVDIGCGDGRIVIEAVKECGCKALGIEENQWLVNKAISSAKPLNLEGRLQFSHSSFTNQSLKSASVVFIFLPVTSLNSLITILSKQLRKGARIIAHEQQKVNFKIKPDKTKLIVSDSALSVAYLWIVS